MEQKDAEAQADDILEQLGKKQLNRDDLVGLIMEMNDQPQSLEEGKERGQVGPDGVQELGDMEFAAGT